MLTCDGNSGTIECLTEADIMQKATELFESFNPNKEEALRLLENLQTTAISEQKFCNIIGRLRLYQSLPLAEVQNHRYGEHSAYHAGDECDDGNDYVYTHNCSSYLIINSKKAFLLHSDLIFFLYLKVANGSCRHEKR
jgi:hypothetical protein